VYGLVPSCCCVLELAAPEVGGSKVGLHEATAAYPPRLVTIKRSGHQPSGLLGLADVSQAAADKSERARR
jgi:hypothetical protein